MRFHRQANAADMSRNLKSYAGFWRRVGASLIDTLFVTIIFLFIFGDDFFRSELLSPAGLLQDALLLVITVTLWLKFLGTPGKLLMGCQVVDADSFQPISGKQALIRYLGYYVSLLSLGLGFFWIAWDKRKQGFHDKMANTVVLYNAGVELDDESQKNLSQLLAELR